LQVLEVTSSVEGAGQMQEEMLAPGGMFRVARRRWRGGGGGGMRHMSHCQKDNAHAHTPPPSFLVLTTQAPSSCV
jgi:hypothetical protein